MVALLISLLVSAGMLIAVLGIVMALEARGALWLDLIVNGARPFDPAARAPSFSSVESADQARSHAAA